MPALITWLAFVLAGAAWTCLIKFPRFRHAKVKKEMHHAKLHGVAEQPLSAVSTSNSSYAPEALDSSEISKQRSKPGINKILLCSGCERHSKIEGEVFAACAGCHIARYCSRKCQKTDYKRHKPECHAWQQIATEKDQQELARHLEEWLNLTTPIWCAAALSALNLRREDKMPRLNRICALVATVQEEHTKGARAHRIKVLDIRRIPREELDLIQDGLMKVFDDAIIDMTGRVTGLPQDAGEQMPFVRMVISGSGNFVITMCRVGCVPKTGGITRDKNWARTFCDKLERLDSDRRLKASHKTFQKHKGPLNRPKAAQ